jgi:aspartyl-tRNA(Asn)/glutamyl-tRNA(Gln) amidotransferase subunit A
VSPDRPAAASVRSLAAAFRDGRQSPLDFIERMLTRIDENAAAHAYITICRDAALDRARRAGASATMSSAGPLHGIPYACKDMFFSKGIVTTAGSRVLENWIPDHDAAVIERLSGAGAILIGKANMHEFAHGITGENARFGTPPNPWDSARLAGGSSSGSAVAVALGLACFALGSDTGGSTRVPAALCGVVGLKPTYGRVSLFGAVPYCWSIDHAGIIAASVEDAAEVLKVIAGYDARDPVSADTPVEDYPAALAGPSPSRIGVIRPSAMPAMDASVEDAYRGAVARFAAGGSDIVEVDLPDLEQARTVSLLVQMPEVLSYHRRNMAEKSALYGDDVRAGLALGQFILAEHYVTAKRMIETYRRAMDGVFRRIDALLTPTCPVVAPKIGDTTVSIGGILRPIGSALTCFTGFFNMTGNPAITVPCGRDAGGLPIGLQIVGRPFEESMILRLARDHEQRGGQPSA